MIGVRRRFFSALFPKYRACKSHSMSRKVASEHAPRWVTIAIAISRVCGSETLGGGMRAGFAAALTRFSQQSASCMRQETVHYSIGIGTMGER